MYSVTITFPIKMPFVTIDDFAFRDRIERNISQLTGLIIDGHDSGEYQFSIFCQNVNDLNELTNKIKEVTKRDKIHIIIYL